jgi:hypothetical protein
MVRSALSHEKFKFILWPMLQFHSAFSCEWMRFLSSQQASEKKKKRRVHEVSTSTYEYFMNGGKGKVSYSQSED